MHEFKKAIERILKERTDAYNGVEMTSEEAMDHLSEVYHAIKDKL